MSKQLDDIDLTKGAAIATRLYVQGALEQAEKQIILAVKTAFAEARSTYVGDLTSDEPFRLLFDAVERVQG